MPYVYNMTEGVTIQFKLRSNGTIRTIAYGERYFTNASNAVDITITCDSDKVIYAMRTEPEHFNIVFLRGSVQTITRSNLTFPNDVNIYVDLVPTSKIRNIKYLERNVDVLFYDTVKEQEFIISRANDYLEESNFNLTIVAKSGYEIVSASTYIDGEYTPFAISSDKKTAIINDVDVTENLTLSITTQEEQEEEPPPPIPTHTIIYDNKDVVVKFDENVLYNNVSKTLEENSYNVLVTAKSGYLIESVFALLDGEYISFPVNEDNKSAGTIIFLNGDLELTIHSKLEPPPIEYYQVASGNNENVTILMNDVPLTFGEVVELEGKSYTILVTAKEGFLINSVGAYMGGEFVSFTISDDKYTAETNIVLNDSIGFNITTIVEQPPQEVTGFNHLYLVDSQQLKNLASERFGRGGEDFGTVIDLGNFIINVLELPFPVNADFKGLETPIMLGYELITTTAIELLGDNMRVNIGSIEVPNKYNNSYDLLNTDVILHLPFCNSIQLDVNYVVGHTITILYTIDLYSGEATLNVKSTKLDGKTFHNEVFKIGKNIPFIRKGDGNIFGTADGGGIYNEIYNAYIEVIRNEPYEVDNIFNSDTSIRTQLINEIGFLYVDNIILNTNATLHEQNTIINLLRNGVYIK